MEDLEVIIASLGTIEDGFKTVSSQEESLYGDDTSTSLTIEDESYQIREHILTNFSVSMLVNPRKNQ